MIAAYNGQTSAVKLLVERGADINVDTNDGYTALIYAAFSGDAKIVQILVEAGADVNAINEYGANALIYAAHKVNLHNYFKFHVRLYFRRCVAVSPLQSFIAY